MSSSNICLSEQFTFLNYINPHYLFYSIIIGTFASLFGLVWILKTYTYFEKQKITRGSLPTFPYGNFREIIKKNTSLHTFLWKYYNKFKRKKLRFGGLFLLVRPVIVAVDSSADSNGASLFPKACKLKPQEAATLLNNDVSNCFIKNFNSSVKAAISETLLKSDAATVFKDYLLESTCLLFGFQGPQLVEEINELLEENFATSFKYYLRLCFPVLQKLQSPPKPHKRLLELMEARKKNDSEANDLIESFTRLLNESDYTVDDIAEEVFNAFLDTLSFSCSSLLFCFYELAINSETQQELMGEIRRFNQKNEALTYENLGQMEFLNATVKETFRKYPPVSTIIQQSKDLDWNPDKNGLIFQSILGIHRDPQFYTKPEAFEPDRFMDSIPVNEDTYLPFGVGAGSQLRMQLVSLQMALVLVGVFSHLKVGLRDGGAPFKYNPKLLYLSPSEGPHLEFSRI
nr:cytochrome P450 CYP393A1 [Dendroctonus rhizophagus]